MFNEKMIRREKGERNNEEKSRESGWVETTEMVNFLIFFLYLASLLFNMRATTVFPFRLGRLGILNH